jgi:hypothetical protein
MLITQLVVYCVAVCHRTSYQYKNVHMCVRVHIMLSRGAQVFQKSRSHLKVLDARVVTVNNLRTKNLQILGPTVQNLVAQVTWRL